MSITIVGKMVPCGLENLYWRFGVITVSVFIYPNGGIKSFHKKLEHIRQIYTAYSRNLLPLRFLLYTRRGSGERSRYSDTLRARGSGVRTLLVARFATAVQTGPETHPATYTMGS
jgi:hypothetical protein